jgi:hypothetical protein
MHQNLFGSGVVGAGALNINKEDKVRRSIKK